MTSDEYEQQTKRTEVTPLFVNNRDGKPDSLLSLSMHAAMGMVTEAAEAIDMLKKHVIYGKPFDPINLLEEVGDTTWYCALMLRALGYNFRDAFDRNISKLLKRYPDKFSEDAAINRDVVAERAVLEEGLPTTEDIALLCRKLDQLCADPHPGLSTWVEARNDLGRQLHTALGKVLR